MEHSMFLKVSEVSRVMGLSRYYINRLVRAGKLEMVQIGPARFVTVTSVNKLMAELGRSDRNE